MSTSSTIDKQAIRLHFADAPNRRYLQIALDRSVECDPMYTNSHKAPVPKRGWLQVKQGKIFFECVGEGEAIAFLHGFGLDSRMWAPQLEVFQATFRVIRYDLRGFGRSSLPVACDYAHEDAKSASVASRCQPGPCCWGIDGRKDGAALCGCISGDGAVVSAG